MLQFDKDGVTNFDHFEKHQDLAMLSKAPGKDKLQITFAHKVSEDLFFLQKHNQKRRFQQFIITRVFGIDIALVGVTDEKTSAMQEFLNFPSSFFPFCLALGKST